MPSQPSVPTEPTYVIATFERAAMRWAEQAWQWSFVAYTTWWNLAVAPWTPLPEHPRHLHAAHDQLEVPSPVGDDGEHALFA